MALDPKRWTLKLQEAFQAASDRATAGHQAEIAPEHLLLAFLAQEDGVTLPILAQLGRAPVALRNELENRLARLPRAYGGAEPRPSRATLEALETADRTRADMGDEFVSVEHVLLALSGLLGVDREQLLSALRAVRGSHRVTSPEPEETYRALERYGRDLTAAARAGKLDPVIGRDEEIRRVVQVLSRRTKNNPAKSCLSGCCFV
jgi:ATP-dependent Clp protease ATP-binding subunit ClpB